MVVRPQLQKHHRKARMLELLFGLPWMSQEAGLIRAGVCVRQQWETKDRGWGGSEMNTSRLLGLFADEACTLWN